jgi:hypothetical protein
MATTPTYSWPIPDDTDLVKDGAEAIRDLGNAIDTTVDGLGVGLVHIKTTSFSAVSGQSFNEVFTADYQFYRIITEITSISTDLTLTFRFRVSNADNSQGVYTNNNLLVVNGVVSGSAATTNTSQTLGGLESTDPRIYYAIDIYNPFNVAKTLGFLERFTISQTAEQVYTKSAFGHNDTVAFTGFSLLASTGNMTGKTSVFGYKE